MRLFKRKKSEVQPSHEPNLRRHELPAQPASSIRPPVDDAFLRRGDELLNDGDYQSAAFMYNEALRQDKNNALLYLKLSLARMLSSPPQLDQALQDINSAIQISPSMGEAWKQKGDIYMLKGDNQAAEEALVQAMGMLEGLEKVKAQRSLSEIRLRNPQHTPLSPIPTLQVATELPIRPHVQVQPADAHTTTATTPPTLSTSTRLTPSSSQSVPAHNLSPPSLVSPPSLLPTTPGVGIPSLGSSSALRSPSPYPAARSEVLAQELNIPTEAPPQYSATPRLPTSIAGGVDSFIYESQTTNLRNAITTKRQGALYLKPYTAEGQIDSIQLLFYGKNYLESILLDLPPQPQVHQTWKKYHCDTIAYPGTTFLDLDCESAASHEGYLCGSTSVTGYSEEYREYQLLQKPLLTLFFETQTVPPIMSIDSIVERIKLLQLQPTLEDNRRLSEILGLGSALYTLSATTQTSIEDICMAFHRGQYTAPTRFVDFLTTATFSRHIFGTGGIGLTNFLFHILLGAELCIRLRRAGTGIRYPNIMTNTTSALVMIAHQWMENVTIRVVPPPLGSPVGTRTKHTLIANNHTRQSEGLIRFAEALTWPYLDEARQNIENSYSSLIANPNNLHDYLKDWLYGLCLPGKYFRHRIMSCLVLASSPTKHISSAPYYDNGLVVGNKSYWPKRTVLGRVLGGMRDLKSTCGWIGPVPAPTGFPTGWILLNARRVNFAIPALDDLTETGLEILGFSEADAAGDPQGLVREISNLDLWKPPSKLPARVAPNTPNTAGSPSAVRLEAIRLEEVTVTGAAAIAGTKHYRAMLDFMCHNIRVTFTLYSNPVFVHVPKCVGATHPIHDRKVRKHFENVVLAKDLKSGSVTLPSMGQHSLLIIDATEPGEEAMARAWCAESGRHAVVRKNGIGCFTCATNLAASRTGLGFGVLVWCS